VLSGDQQCCVGLFFSLSSPHSDTHTEIYYTQSFLSHSAGANHNIAARGIWIIPFWILTESVSKSWWITPVNQSHTSIRFHQPMNTIEWPVHESADCFLLILIMWLQLQQEVDSRPSLFPRFGWPSLISRFTALRTASQHHRTTASTIFIE